MKPHELDKLRAEIAKKTAAKKPASAGRKSSNGKRPHAAEQKHAGDHVKKD